MNIYVSHSREFDFKNELYIPLRNSELNKRHNIILPHENSDENYSSKEFFRDFCQLVIAEVSFKGTGLGIELGWANNYDVPIIAVYKNGFIPARSITSVTNTFIDYSNPQELIDRLTANICNREFRKFL